jgi:ribosomal protein L11 methyltransferase
MRGSRRADYYEARLDVPAHLEEPSVAAFWEAGCLGVEVVSAARTRRRPRIAMQAYFSGHLSRPSLQRRIAAALRRAGLDLPGPPDLHAVPAGDWVEQWQRTLKPMRVGRRFLIIPEGVRAPALRGRLPIHVRFGQAFGTGEHATTRMSLRLLESCLVPGDRVIDLGAGTCILSIAARRLGARSVLAVDNDPVAIGVARDTLKENDLVRRVRLRLDDAGRAIRAGRFDLALVNIGATIITRILPRLAAALQPGGRAILTGHLIEDEPELIDRGRDVGLDEAKRLRSGSWSALVLTRPRP